MWISTFTDIEIKICSYFFMDLVTFYVKMTTENCTYDRVKVTCNYA